MQMGATSGFSAGSSKPIPTCSATFLRNATSSFNLLYTSATLLLDQPSQKRIRSSGAGCFLSQVVRNRRNAWAPAFGWPNVLSNWCRESLKTFDCKRGRPFFDPNRKPEVRFPMYLLSIVATSRCRSISRTPFSVFRNG